MSEMAIERPHLQHEELSFWWEMFLGGLMALLMRWQLAWPETSVPGLSLDRFEE